MEDSGDQYIAYSLEELQQMVEKAKQLNSGNGLKRYLLQNGFKQEGDNLFSHQEPTQLIELRPGENGITYVNRMDENDKGQYIQFFQNRLLSDKRIIPNQKMHTFLGAVAVAMYHERFRKQAQLKVKSIFRKERNKRRGI